MPDMYADDREEKFCGEFRVSPEEYRRALWRIDPKQAAFHRETVRDEQPPWEAHGGDKR